MEKQEYVSLWLGNCQSYDELDSYLTGSYSSDGDYINSQFQKDFKIDWFDEDFREAFHNDLSSNDFQRLLDGCSYENSIIKAFNNNYVIKEEFNAGLLLYDFMYEGKIKEIKSKGIYLKFIGAIKYEKES